METLRAIIYWIYENEIPILTFMLGVAISALIMRIAHNKDMARVEELLAEYEESEGTEGGQDEGLQGL